MLRGPHIIHAWYRVSSGIDILHYPKWKPIIDMDSWSDDKKGRGVQEYDYIQQNHWKKDEGDAYRKVDEDPMYFMTKLKLNFKSMFSGSRKFHSVPKDKTTIE